LWLDLLSNIYAGTHACAVLGNSFRNGQERWNGYKKSSADAGPPFLLAVDLRFADNISAVRKWQRHCIVARSVHGGGHSSEIVIHVFPSDLTVIREIIRGCHFSRGVNRGAILRGAQVGRPEASHTVALQSWLDT
jgi:hypothetical protein